METITKNVADLNAPERSALEGVIGHPLAAGQQLVIQVVSPAPQVSTAIKSRLPDWCNVYEGLSDAEVDDISSAIVREHSSREFD